MALEGALMMDALTLNEFTGGASVKPTLGIYIFANGVGTFPFIAGNWSLLGGMINGNGTMIVSTTNETLASVTSGAARQIPSVLMIVYGTTAGVVTGLNTKLNEGDTYYISCGTGTTAIQIWCSVDSVLT
jgi:hypothetical protein